MVPQLIWLTKQVPWTLHNCCVGVTDELTSKDKDKQQQSSFIQSPWPSLMNTLEPAFNTSRRRSVDIATTGYPSPPSATPSLYRRASLDLITATNSTDNDIGRDSDASTSETAVSDPPSCSTFVNPMMPESNDSKSLLEIQVSADSAEKSRVESSPMGRSVSQSLRSLGRGATRRASSASEPNARQSFDLRSFAFSRGRMAPQEEEVEENGYSSTPRRRSIQESFGFSGNDQDEKSFFSHPSGMTSSASASSIHETSLQGHNNTSKHRASFSGSATISGRFSRFWSYGPAKDGQEGGVHGKDGFADSLQSIDGGNGDWNTEATAFHQSNKYAAGGRPRVGVMNRFSGMWSRR
ncbi:hypothetical protein BC939DRAFT_86402 [Gamsiella multidivaricata]|uniref:uncharacterized protein n=1 Tax=Gamsiella multidivaricata TaxID=101098 RepID=UPI0022207F7F|nr:uncharacterized protein BC939DRAFT_86402 [Gamsiella multidivaricata]KAI7827660.1 hypothetical protein BC939DRAFT_86402 [Gamsiella multidivaricata]